MTWEEAVHWLREQPDQQFLVKACYYDDPLVDAAKRYYIDPEWMAIRQLIPSKHGDALDVGGGRGISSYALAMDGWNVTALEPNPGMLVGAGAIRQLVDETGIRINVVEEWGEQLPFPDESFDLLHARQVLHHAHDLNIFCKELFRVLKPGGMLIATREHVIDKPQDLQVFLDAHPLHRFYGGENAFTLKEYKKALLAAGFELSRVFSPWETPINYFPGTFSDIQNTISEKLHWPWAGLIPNILVNFLSRRLNNPGRLYTFIAEKRLVRF